MPKKKVNKAIKIGAIVVGVTVECGIIFLAYLGGGELAHEIHSEYCGPNPDYKHAFNVTSQYALYGWDRLLHLGICE